MRFKTYTHALPWTDKVDWCWPAGDEKLVLVVDHVSDIDLVLQHVDGRGVCIQAGGACGVWPLRLSQEFERVVTFEPMAENFACLLTNIHDADNIVALNAPLSNTNDPYRICNDIHEIQNYGAGYCVPDSGGVEAILIDQLDIPGCDLIYLDIEGFELNALKGGFDTISEHRPTIVLEQKPLNHVDGDPQAAMKWLQEQFGYEPVAKYHWDYVLKC